MKGAIGTMEQVTYEHIVISLPFFILRNIIYDFIPFMLKTDGMYDFGAPGFL